MLFFSFWSLALLSADRGDAVVMTINNEEITLSEFEYFYNKNNIEGVFDRKTLDEYIDIFVNFKLKVAAAKEANLDTISTFIDEFKEYRGLYAEDYLIDKEYLENVAYDAFKRSAEEVGPDGVRLLSTIVIVPEDDTRQCDEAAHNKIDSIYNMIMDGRDFGDLATIFSQDVSSSQGGILGWMSRSQLVPEFSEVAFDLYKGQISEPFRTRAGWQLVKVMDIKTFDSYLDHRDDIYEWMRKQGYYESAKERLGRKLIENNGWDLTPQQAVDRHDSLLETIYPEFRNISREFYEGLLFFEISNREIWEKASTDTVALIKYFNKNRSSYKFEKPKFKGMLFFCQNQELFNQVKDSLSGYPHNKWVNRVVPFNSDSVVVRVMRGPFEPGDNVYVDKLAFGIGDFSPLKQFNHVDVIGYIVTKPESFEDVAGYVITDYQNDLEQKWIRKLRKRYKVKLNKKILYTINQ